MERNAENFKWELYRDAERYLKKNIDQFTDENAFLRDFEVRLKTETSTRLFDWTDHLIFPMSAGIREKLIQMEFLPENVPLEASSQVFFHPGSVFPRIMLVHSDKEAGEKLTGMALQAENLSLLLNVLKIYNPIEGSPFSPYRRARLWDQPGSHIQAVERRGYNGYLPQRMPGDYADRYLRWLTACLNRRRAFTDIAEGMNQTLKMLRTMVDQVGRDTAAWIFFEAERVNWMLKNRTGQIQKQRQDKLGLGWANHDHHTFRSSRPAFPRLLEILRELGFEFREKFYAGAMAGWGAQVMEQYTSRLVVFADVDLLPEELELDFHQAQLTPRLEKGTVGLWCALHGESVLEAGLHHLAARFLFDKLGPDLEKEKVILLPPFSNFPYLRQAFSQGERWQVEEKRIRDLEHSKVLLPEQALNFLQEGVIGSHLENIQRDQGFKGFNQESVSDIIRRTDPRLESRNA